MPVPKPEFRQLLVEAFDHATLISLIAEEVEINVEALSPTGYQKRTGQFLRALHVYSIDDFVAF